MKSQTKTILVVDDDEGMRDTLSAILKRDYDIRVAATGEEGLSVLKKADINLMLLDVRMPGMSGLEVLKVVRDHYSEVEVIMVSAINEVEVAVQAIKDGGPTTTSTRNSTTTVFGRLCAMRCSARTSVVAWSR